MAKGDNADADKFTYEILENATGKYVRLTGLTEEGKKAVELTLPSDYDGIPVRTFAVGVFAGNETISKVVLPSTISTIYDGSFEGAKRLNALVFEHDSVLAINMGQDFLKGADNCYIYVKTGVSTVDCAGGWARYSERIRYYD